MIMKTSHQLEEMRFCIWSDWMSMDYFDYSYKHNYIEFSSSIYRVGTYHYNWHDETEILILLKGQM